MNNINNINNANNYKNIAIAFIKKLEYYYNILEQCLYLTDDEQDLYFTLEEETSLLNKYEQTARLHSTLEDYYKIISDIATNQAPWLSPDINILNLIDIIEASDFYEDYEQEKREKIEEIAGEDAWKEFNTITEAEEYAEECKQERLDLIHYYYNTRL